MEKIAKSVKCGTHGPSAPAFVCSHLAYEKGRPLGFFAPEYDPADPEQQAWCGDCEKALVGNNGDWTDELVEQAGLMVVCEFCFDTMRQFHRLAT